MAGQFQLRLSIAAEDVLASVSAFALQVSVDHGQ